MGNGGKKGFVKGNRIKIFKDRAQVSCGTGFFIIDVDDVPFARTQTWHINNHGRPTNSKGRLFYRMLVQAPKGVMADHKDGNKINNRRKNIRLCDRSANSLNQPARSDNKSGYKGVSRTGGTKFRNKCWIAQTQLNGVFHHLGYYHTPEEASAAYEAFAAKNHGEFYYKNGFKERT